MATTSGSFSVTSWKEDAYDEPESPEGGGRLTRATVELAFSGAIDGVASVEWLMAYRADGTAHFVGLARIRGSVDGRAGTFVLENTGEFDGMVARGEWSVVRGSGTGDLQDLSGTGGFEAGQEATYTLHHALA